MTEEKVWQLPKRQIIEKIAAMVEAREDTMPGAADLAEEIRALVKTPRFPATLVYDTHVAHPDWSAHKIADFLGCDPRYVSQCAQRGSWQPAPYTKEEQTENRRQRALGAWQRKREAEASDSD